MSPTEIGNDWSALHLPLIILGCVIWIGVSAYLSFRWKGTSAKTISISFVIAVSSVSILFIIALGCMMLAQSALDHSIH